MSKTTNAGAPTSEGAGELQRGLSNRHIQLIAIGGAIGTGLFLGSGIGIHKAGPSILLVYIIVGTALYFMMRAMGELLLSNLGYRTFQDFADEYLGAWGRYFIGWTYWLCLLSMSTADVVGIQKYAQFWFPALPGWIPILIAIIAVLALNLIAVRAFGEAEFWFALIKVITILALIAVAIVLIVTGYRSPSGDRASIAVPLRILFFYVLALGVIICVTPWSKIQPDRSPFVALFVLIGLSAAAGIINFVVLTSATSAANSGIFSSSRMAYGLATVHQAPHFLARLTSNAVPGIALVMSCVVLFLGGMLGLLFVNAFELVTTVASILFIFVWSLILISYLIYRRRRPDLHAASTYKMPGGVVMSYVVLAFFVFVIVVLAFGEQTRLALIGTPLWFVFLSITYFARKRRAGISEREREIEEDSSAR